MLQVESKEKYFLESAAFDLDEFEGSAVTLRGTLERNIDPSALPVLIVREIDGFSAQTRTVFIAAFGMTMDIPSTWRETRKNNLVAFSASGASAPVLVIGGQSTDQTPPQFFSSSAAPHMDGKETVPIVVASKRALRVYEADSTEQTIYIDRDEGQGNGKTRIIVILFHPPEGGEKVMTEVFLKTIQSIKFGREGALSSQATSSSAGSESAASSGLGKPCGGPAGILCPAGQYCDVTDLTANIGICKKW